MTKPPTGPMNPEAGVTAARPAMAPVARPSALGLPCCTHSTLIQVKAAVAAEIRVTAMAMEAQLAAKETQAAKPVTAADVIAFARAVEAAKEKLVETQAANFNGYWSNDAGFKARCYLKKQVGPDKIVITEDWTAK